MSRVRLALLISAVLAAAVAPAARAAVRIGSRTIVLSTAAGDAVVTRSPLQIRFTDSRGHTVLREVASRAASLRLAPPPPPLAPMFGPPLQDTLYAPLEFTVGHESIVTRESGTWAGDLLSAVRTGTVYHALRVRSARPAGHGVRLVVSTTDPSGRMLIVTISPGVAGTIRVSARPSPALGVAGMGDSFASGRGELFHGFGGMHLGLDQSGASFFSWTAEENVNATAFHVPGSEAGTLLYPNGPQAEYYPQASFVSSRPYGFALDQPELARFRLDADGGRSWQADVAARRLDYLVVPGSAAQAVAALTAIGGRQPVAPRWALEPSLDRETQLNQKPSTYVAQVRQDLTDIKRYHLPLEGYRLEGWGALPAATVRGLIVQLHRMGIHALVYFRTFVSNDTAGTEAPGAFAYATSHRLVARTRSGAPYLFGDPFGGKAALLDFTNRATLSWWRSRVRAALDLGADGFMQDFGEEVMPNMIFSDGESGLRMHNRYPVLYARATRRIFSEYMRQHPGRQLFFYTRDGYSGSPGSAAYEGGNFAGDETTDWTRSSGLQSVIPDMLNRAIGGAYGYTTDIGGYFDVYTPQPTTKELFLRWAELAVFTPLFRLHGSLLHGVHLPWTFDAQTVRVYNQLSHLHEQAVPLIQRLWRVADRTGMPPTRPLWLAYPGDRAAARQDQEWLFGPDLLVAPVVTEGARSRQVYFPPGCWRSPQAHITVRGPGSRTVSAPLTRLPYFTRCGTRPLG